VKTETDPWDYRGFLAARREACPTELSMNNMFFFDQHVKNYFNYDEMQPKNTVDYIVCM